MKTAERYVGKEEAADFLDWSVTTLKRRMALRVCEQSNTNPVGGGAESMTRGCRVAGFLRVRAVAFGKVESSELRGAIQSSRRVPGVGRRSLRLLQHRGVAGQWERSGAKKGEVFAGGAAGWSGAARDSSRLLRESAHALPFRGDWP